MKIALINPPSKTSFPQPPLGLVCIAAVLEKNGHEVNIIDAQALKIDENEVAERIAGANVVGITSMTPTFNSAVNVAKAIKKINNSCFIIMGGPHVTVLPEKTLDDAKEVDAIVIGEGELTIIELIKAIEKNEDFEKILGIGYRKNEKIIINSPRPPIEDLDALPMPSFYLLPIEKYRPYPPHGKKLPYMTIMSSRGCPYRCAFCFKTIFGRRYITNSSKVVIEEIKQLVEKFGVKEILFYDDSFTMDRNRTIELCNDLIKNNIKIPWSCETRVNLVDKELLQKMKEAGCYIISYGVESGDQIILNNLKKDITIEQVRNAFKLTKEVGILTVAYFMIGSPGDSNETVRKTINFAKELDADFAQFSICTPFPGSELFDNLIKSGVRIQDWDKASYVTSKSKAEPISLTKELSAEELKKWYSKAYKEFYLRPSYWLKTISRIRSIDDIKIILNGFRMMVNLSG
jgi:radical SAM superfamily enzyme YgiQ (UPF0313 family)